MASLRFAIRSPAWLNFSLEETKLCLVARQRPGIAGTHAHTSRSPLMPLVGRLPVEAVRPMRDVEVEIAIASHGAHVIAVDVEVDEIRRASAVHVEGTIRPLPSTTALATRDRRFPPALTMASRSRFTTPSGRWSPVTAFSVLPAVPRRDGAAYGPWIRVSQATQALSAHSSIRVRFIPCFSTLRHLCVTEPNDRHIDRSDAVGPSPHVFRGEGGGSAARGRTLKSGMRSDLLLGTARATTSR